MTLPNFLIIGAHKAGTTSLYSYLRQHPQIYMPELKELRYLAYDERDPDHYSKSVEIFPVRSLQEYEQSFDGVTVEKAIGEASPVYLNSQFSPGRIYECIPDVKLIASLRNPVDCTYSAYLMQYRAGRESRPIEEAFTKNERLAHTGMYFKKLERYLDVFHRSQIKIVLFDDLKTDPSKVCGELFAFLRVDERFEPDVSVRHNQGGIPRSKLAYRLLSNRRIKNILKPIVPHTLHTAASQLKHRALKPARPLTKEMRARMLDYYREDTRRLQELLGRDLSAWQR